MIAIDGGMAALLALLLGFWLAAAVAATIIGLRRTMAARAARAQADRFAALIDGAPAIPMLIGADGRIDASPRLAIWLGLDSLPERIDGLAGPDSGLRRDDAEALVLDVGAARRAGRSFTRAVRIEGSDRVFTVTGQPAAPELGGGTILWFFDSTQSQVEIDRLAAEAARAGQALSALSSLIEAAPFPMWHRGPDLRLALVNSAYVRAVEGQDAADVVRRGLELVDSVDGIGPIAAAAAAREAGAMAQRNAPATIGGERRMIRIVDVPLGEAGVAGYAVDVEELEEARADLGRFARAQRDLLDRLSAGVAQFGPDRSLVFFNQNFLRLFALKPEWLTDGPEFDRVLERMREAQRLPESRDFPNWKAERRAWFNAAVDAIEEAWHLPGGTHLRVVAQPLPDGGLVLIFEDRTEQIQLASARDTLLQVRAATFDNLFEAVGIFAADGRLHSWNTRFRELWGLEEEALGEHPRVDQLVELVGKRLANPARASLIRELVRAATVERQQRSGRVAFADGRHFEFAAVPLPDGNALFTLLDITASRRIEAALRERTEALEAADQLKTAFVANMSYELRVPLTSLQGFAEMLAAGYAGALDPRAKDYVDAILASVGRLATLIDDMLDLTQSEAGNLALADERVDIESLTRAAAAEAALLARDRSITLQVDVEPLLGLVEGDSRRLRKAVDHVLRHAIGDAPSRGSVLFKVAAAGPAIEMLVAASGPDVDDERREKMVERARRTAVFSRDPGNGLGLGLPLTRRLIEAHGGSIELIAEPGLGNAVIIRLPRERQAAA